MAGEVIIHGVWINSYWVQGLSLHYKREELEDVILIIDTMFSLNNSLKK